MTPTRSCLLAKPVQGMGHNRLPFLPRSHGHLSTPSLHPSPALAPPQSRPGMPSPPQASSSTAVVELASAPSLSHEQIGELPFADPGPLEALKTGSRWPAMGDVALAKTVLGSEGSNIEAAWPESTTKLLGEHAISIVSDTEQHQFLRRLIVPALSAEAMDVYLPQIMVISPDFMTLEMIQQSLQEH
eukprot:gene27994-32422_t